MQSFLYNRTFILALNVSLFIFYLIRQKLSKSITKKIKLIFKIRNFKIHLFKCACIPP